MYFLIWKSALSLHYSSLCLFCQRTKGCLCYLSFFYIEKEFYFIFSSSLVKGELSKMCINWTSRSFNEFIFVHLYYIKQINFLLYREIMHLHYAHKQLHIVRHVVKAINIHLGTHEPCFSIIGRLYQTPGSSPLIFSLNVITS